MKLKEREKPTVEIKRKGNQFRLSAFINSPKNCLSVEQVHKVENEYNVHIYTERGIIINTTYEEIDKSNTIITTLDDAVKEVIKLMRQHNKYYQELKNKIDNHKNFI